MTAKNRHLCTIAQICWAISSQIRHLLTIGKKLVKQQYLLHMSSQYGELWPTSVCYLLASLGHPSKFQWVSRLGSVTARHSSSGRQPNFAVLNRGRHLYSARWPSRWALAHILLFSSPNLSGLRLDAYHTSTHGVALVRIKNAGLKCAARGSLKIQDAKNSQKIAILAPSHNFVGLYHCK